MPVEETQRDLTLKRFQIGLGILVGLVSLTVGVYNVKNMMFSKKGPGSVFVQVMADGRAVPQAAVQITTAQGGIVATSETGQDGQYTRKSLEPGHYSLKVVKAGYQPEMLLFSVDPAQSAELKLALKPATGSIRSALEETGASWIKELGKPKPSGQPKEEAAQ